MLHSTPVGPLPVSRPRAVCTEQSDQPYPSPPRLQHPWPTGQGGEEGWRDNTRLSSPESSPTGRTSPPTLGGLGSLRHREPSHRPAPRARPSWSPANISLMESMRSPSAALLQPELVHRSVSEAGSVVSSTHSRLSQLAKEFGLLSIQSPASSANSGFDSLSASQAAGPAGW